MVVILVMCSQSTCIKGQVESGVVGLGLGDMMVVIFLLCVVSQLVSKV
jgi:hypothetical protein